MKTLYSFNEFLDSLVVEELHPELKDIVSSTTSKVNKKTLLAKKIRDLSARGESTGIEGNMPAGSSRAYMKHKDPEKIHIDGKPAEIQTGTKVAITSTLDHYFKKTKHYDGESLGQMQNRVENGDHFSNQNYRVLTHSDGDRFHTNERGIFPPLLAHDDEHHNWSHIGHADKLTSGSFKKITKTDSHPNGISHEDFTHALCRRWNQNHGRYWTQSPERELQLDHIESHPLVDKFLDHQNTFSSPPHDYRQLGNMGVWTHPHTGEKHIVARDSGFNNEVAEAYQAARQGGAPIW